MSEELSNNFAERRVVVAMLIVTGGGACDNSIDRWGGEGADLKVKKGGLENPG